MVLCLRENVTNIFKSKYRRRVRSSDGKILKSSDRVPNSTDTCVKKKKKITLMQFIIFQYL